MSFPCQDGALPLPVMPNASSARGQILSRAPPVIETPQDEPPEDEALMLRLQARDDNAFDILFNRYARLVYSVALRILKDRGEAEDVVQETFFQIYERALLFSPGKGPVRAWLVKVAYYRALDRRAYLVRRRFYPGTKVDLAEDTVLGTTDLDREIGATLNRALLERAFAELPESQRRTLEMFYFEGVELRDIAETLNQPLGNIRHHYYRGLERLRKSTFVAKLRKDDAT